MSGSDPMADADTGFDKERAADGDAALAACCRRILGNTFSEFCNARFDVRFYPYIGLTHTIRRKDGVWRIRISDHCLRAPAAVLEAIILMLACKVARRKPPADCIEIYESFRRDPAVTEAVKTRRLRKGKKRIIGHPGHCHSLPDICRDVNRRWFNDQVDINRIGWGYRNSWRRLGHYDPVHHTVTLSPVLDSPAVPEFVVSFIVYHEMLHALFNGTSGGSRRYHSREFHRAERAHPDFERVAKFIRDYCRRCRR